MSNERQRVKTGQDESDEDIGGLIVIGVMLVICVAIFSAIFKYFGSPETGAIIGLIFGGGVIIKIKWMRDLVIGLALFATVVGVFISSVALLIWAFG